MDANRARKGCLGCRSAAGASAALVVGLACVTGATAAETVRSSGVQDQVLERIVDVRLGLFESDLFELHGVVTPGVPIEATIPVNGEDVTLDLVPYSVRAVEYKVYLSDAGGNLTEVEPGPVNTMRGNVRGHRGSFAAAAVVGGGLYGRVELGDGSTWWFEPVADQVGARAGVHVIYHADDVIPTDGRCDTNGLAREAGNTALRDDAGEPAAGGPAETELAIDADFFYHNRWGDETVDRVNAVIDQMNVQYERDVDITHKIIGVVIRLEQVYTASDSGVLIQQVISRWRNNRPERDIVRDCVQMFTARGINGNVIGRAAAIGGMCTDSLGYNFVKSDFNNNFACATDLSAHELGHTWNAIHCNCTSFTMNPFITCTNRFNPVGTIPTIVNYRNSRNCLDTPPVRGRCCFPDLTCELLFADECIAAGGEPGPQGAQCDSCPLPPGRCCFPDGTCEVLSESQCDDQGGDPGPPASECDGSCPPAVPENDTCLDGFAIGEGTFEFDSTSASTDGPTLPANCDEGNGLSFVKDVWYFYSPTCEGDATVSLCNSDYDTRVAVYLQTGPCPGVFLACNDDACGAGGTRSQLTFAANPALLYTIRVGGVADGGPGELVVTCGTPPPCPGDLDDDNDVDFADLLQLLSAWGPYDPCPPYKAEDLDQDCEVGFGDLLSLLAAWGPCEG